MTAKPRLLVARRVPEAVAARAAREFDAVLAGHDMEAEEAIAAAREHAAQGMLTGPKVRLRRGRSAGCCRRRCASSPTRAPAPTTWMSPRRWRMGWW